VESGQGYSLQLSSEFTQDTTINLSLQISGNGTHYWNDIMPLDIVTSIPTEERSLPEFYLLEQNYPNPFNPTTAIGYRLLAVSDVELTIHNILGQKIATLVSEKKNAGSYQAVWDGSGFPSGIYYYVLKAGEFRDVKKMVLLR